MDTFGLSNYLGSVSQAEEERGLKASEQIAETAKADNDYEQEENRKNNDLNTEQTELSSLLDLGSVEAGKYGLKSLKSAGTKLLKNKLKEYGIDSNELKDKGYNQLKKMVKNFKQKAQDKIDSVRGKVQNQVDSAKSKLEDKADDLRTKVSDVKDDLQSKVDDVKSSADGKINDIQNGFTDAKTTLSDIPPEIDSTAIPSTLTTKGVSTGLEGDIPLGVDNEPLDFNNMDENLSRRLVNLVNKDKSVEPVSSLDPEFNQPADILGRPIGKTSMQGVEDPTAISEDTQQFLSGYSNDSVSFMNKMNLEDKIRGRVFRGGKTLPKESNSDVLGDAGERLYARMNTGENLEGILKPEEQAQLKSLRGTIRRKILSKLERKQPVSSDIEMKDFATQGDDELPAKTIQTIQEIPKRADDVVGDEPPVPTEPTTTLEKPPTTTEPPPTQTTLEPPEDTEKTEQDTKEPEAVGEGDKGDILKTGTETQVEDAVKSVGGTIGDVGEIAGASALETSAETAGEIELAGGGPEDPVADVLAGGALIGGAIAGIFAPKPKPKPSPKPPMPIVKQLILNPSQEFGI